MISNSPLTDRLHPTRSRLLARLTWKGCFVCGGLLFTLAVFVLAKAFATFPGDRAALERFQDIHNGWLDTAALTVTSLGGWVAAPVLIVGVAVCLALWRRWTDAMIVLLSVVPMLAGTLLKEAVGRPRPEYFINGAGPSGLSFPSGHALFAMVFGGLLIFLIGKLIAPIGIRCTLGIGVAILILAMGASRVYLGFHWPSDVLGGYLFGAMALLGLVWLRNRLVNRHSGFTDALKNI